MKTQTPTYKEIKESQQQLNQITALTQKIDIARGLDYDDTTSAARQQLLEIRRLDALYGTKVEDTYRKSSESNYDLDIEALRNINIYELLSNETCNPSWLVDFVNCTIDTINQYNEDAAGFRFVGGHLEKRWKPTKKSLTQSVIEVLSLDPEDYVHKKFIKLIESMIDWKYDFLTSSNTDSNPSILIIEEDLKNELLEESEDNIKSNLFDCGIDDIIEYGVYHVQSPEEGRKILEAVKRLYTADYSLSDIDDLKVEDDWARRIDIFLGDSEEIEIDPEWSYESIDEPDSILDDIKEERITREKKTGAKLGGKAKGKKNAAKTITIRVKSTGEIITFDSYKEASEYIGISIDSMKRFSEGKTKKNKLYDIL